MNKKRIIFFTPTFNRTGSEIALYNLITNARNDFEMTVVSKITGELSFELPSDINYVSAESSFLNSFTPNSLIWRTLKKGLLAIKKNISFLNKIHKLYPSDLWYINTITQPDVLSFALQNKIPVILHVHELDQMYNCISGEQLKNMISYPELIIACSATCAEILRVCGRKDKIEINYPAIAFENVATSDLKAREIRKRHGIEENAFLWLMSGTLDTNKNPSVFVDIANKLLKLNSKALFMWICARNDDNGYVQFCKNKAVSLGIDNKILWIPKLKEEYYDYFNACNGFILTSTKEACPIVAIEAMYLGKPLVSFDCGGVREIITHQTGIIVSDYNIELFAQAMNSIMSGEFTFNVSIGRETTLKFDAKIQKIKWEQIISKAFLELSPSKF